MRCEGHYWDHRIKGTLRAIEDPNQQSLHYFI